MGSGSMARGSRPLKWSCGGKVSARITRSHPPSQSLNSIGHLPACLHRASPWFHGLKEAFNWAVVIMRWWWMCTLALEIQRQQWKRRSRGGRLRMEYEAQNRTLRPDGQSRNTPRFIHGFHPSDFCPVLKQASANIDTKGACSIIIPTNKLT